MKALWIGAAALVIASSATAGGPVRVKGYVTKNGTYVAPHYRSSPDSSRYNNWSSQGNYNPYTGKQGTQNPYGSSNYSSPYSSPSSNYGYTPSYGSTSNDDGDDD